VVAEYNITLVYEDNSKPGEIRPEVIVSADRGRMAQVLTNLVNNAVKFSSQKTTVKIGIIKEDFGRDNRHVQDMMEKGRDCIMIYVKDQGLGLEADQLERVFDRFYQVKQQGSGSHGGIGMGLSIARNIIYIHDGDIWAESEGKGKGTTFKILLPKGT
jgi:signal transduction histidine kinase